MVPISPCGQYRSFEFSNTRFTERIQQEFLMRKPFASRRTAVVLTICALSSYALRADDGEAPAGGADESATAAADEVTTATVERGPFRVDVELDGVFEAAEMTEVLIETEEWTDLEVVEAAAHGSIVKPGDLLIRLATEDLDEEIEKATHEVELGKLGLTSAQLDLQSLEHTTPLELEAQQRSLLQSQEDMAHYNEVGEKQSVRSSEVSLLQSQASLEAAQEELEQLEQMYAADDLTEETEEIILKRARQDVEMSQFYFEMSQQSHEDLMEFDLARTRFQMENGLRRAEIDAALAETRLQTALEESRITLRQTEMTQETTEERLEKLRQDRELMEIHATVGGRVMYGECNRGAWSNTATLLESLEPEGTVNADEVLMTIVSPAPLFVRTDVTEANLRHVAAPQEVHVVPTIAPDAKWTATARSFNPIAIGDDLYDATFAVEPGETPVEIMPGMTCKVTVTARFNAEALTLPSDVIFDDPQTPGGKVVYLKTEGGHETRAVTVGLSDETRTEILTGLSEGDVVLGEEP
jgi:multidrug resistance efflux pump